MKNTNNGDINPETLNAMLKMAGKKLGMSPEQLKSTLTNPQKADALLSQIDQTGKVKSTLNDQKSLEQFLNSNPKAKKMISDLLGEKKNG